MPEAEKKIDFSNYPSYYLFESALRKLIAAGGISLADAAQEKAAASSYFEERLKKGPSDKGSEQNKGSEQDDPDVELTPDTPQAGRSTHSGLEAFTRLAQKSRPRAYEGSAEASSIASLLAVVAWLGVIASPILAFILLSYETPYAYADDDWFTRHPLAIFGITLAAIGIFQSFAMIMISGFIKSQIAFQAHLGGIVAGLQTARPEDFR